ncbi:MAG: GTP cyclohydrolase II [Candelaria pacifica]|nr:MAG: GTP cyclohydrolase II [Candelaria pacifica]
MPDLPSHASPALPPFYSLPSDSSDTHSSFDNGSDSPPPTLLSPAFTPPSTPGTSTPLHDRRAASISVDTSLNPQNPPKLLSELPTVDCIVRARIPTTQGTEMFLHLYKNSIDEKEHLAIVFGNEIRSRSLDAVRDGESEMDRMIRGAYTGRLFPGRTSSRVVDGGAGIPSTTSIEGRKDRMTKMEEDSHSIPLVRIHSECYTGETAWSARCDCGEQLDEAARLMSLAPLSTSTPCTSSPGGVIIYLRQEGRGIGLGEKLKAYNLQDLGSDTVEANLLLRHPADARSYGLATAMLVDLGLGGESGVRLLTNNPDKVRAVEGPRREVVVRERVAMVPLAWRTGGKTGVKGVEIGGYLRTKVSICPIHSVHQSGVVFD